MPVRPATTSLHWIVFIVAVMFFLALDLGVFHRKARVVRFREALIWTFVWFLTAMAFGFLIAPRMVPDWEREKFAFGYLLELALSMDNVLVMALLFAYFRVPEEYQHRVLFWGILGALLMRGLMIWLGKELIQKFEWMLYCLGAFLVFTGVRMLFSAEEEVHPEKNIVIRLARHFFPVTPHYEGQKFFTRWETRVALTPLALVLLTVETTDLVFAVDSIPAIFGVTRNPYIVFTSNVFAILGLRSLYFVLAGAINYFRYLKVGLAIVLVFIGIKMLIDNTRFEISTTVSLIIVGSILLISIGLSLGFARPAPRK